MNRSKRWNKAAIVGLALMAVSVLALTFTATAIHASGGPAYKSGTIAAKGLVLGDNGKPIWAEFNAQGEVVREIGEAVDDLQDAIVMPAVDYRAYVAAFEAVEQEHSAHRRIMYRDEYLGAGFTATDGSAIDPPPLQKHSYSVVVRSEDVIHSASVALVLHQSPLDLQRLQTIPESARAVLLGKDRNVITTADVNIGYKAAFYTREDGGDDSLGQSSLGGYRKGQGTLWGPVAGAKVETSMSRFPVYSDENGHYVAPYFIPPCPGFAMDYNNSVFVQLRYQHFDPKRRSPFGTWYEWRQGYDYCVGYSEGYFGASLAGLAAKMSLMSIEAAMAQPINRVDFSIDVAVLTGQASMQNQSRPGIPVNPAVVGTIPMGGTTRYNYTIPDFAPKETTLLDLDGDGNADTVEHWQDENDQHWYKVWLGDSDPATDEPDLKRVADFNPDLFDRGLLKQISKDDLENTDFYVYRVSNGQLVTSRKGLRPNESNPYYGGSASDENESIVNYRMLMRGPASFNYLRPLKFEDWQAATNINEELQGRRADHLRVGEQVKVIMINRATGYMGSAIGTFGENLGSGLISFSPEPIVMRPPNLKIKTERTFDIESGLTAGEQREYIIGFEGSGLTSDKLVAITTEWVDWDGSPLPEDLPGYTGRLAKVVEEHVLGPVSGQIANFDIKPGKHIQLVHLPQADIDNSHYYIHVSGESLEGNPNFSGSVFDSTGAAGEGALQYRPDHYVPVKTPVYDDNATWAGKMAYQKAIDEGYTNLEEPELVYHWVYRPEMQFSLFELEVSKIERTDLDGNVIDILSTDLPVIATTDNQVELFYSLLEYELPVLEPFGPGRDLIFAAGGQEVMTVVDQNFKLKFDDLDHLSLLESEDFLSFRLYQSGDDENVLWEYAFGLTPIGGPNDMYVFADDPQIELYLYLPTHPGDTSEEPKNVTVRWAVIGSSGTLDEYTQESGDGIYLNKLTTSNTAGDKYWVEAEVINSEDDRYVIGSSARLGPFEVIPGKPNSITLTTDLPQIPADNTSELTISATVRDLYNNKVSDGTGVSMSIVGDSGDEIDTSTLETDNGMAQVKVTAGVVVGNRIYEFSASDTAAAQIEIEATAIGLTVSSSGSQLTVGSDETLSITANVVNAADGTPVNWVSSLGKIVGDDVISNGSATATLSASDIAGDGAVFVSVAGEKGIVEVEHVGSGSSVYGKLSHMAIVGDEIFDGTVTVEQWDGEAIYEYNTSTELEIFGAPGDTVRIGLGTPLSPNASPNVYFPLQSIIAGEVEAADGIHMAMAMGEVSEDGSIGALHFTESSYLLVEDSPDLQIQDNLFVSLDFLSDAFETSDWPQIGPDLRSGPTLVKQGNDSQMAYRFGLVELEGDIKIEAVVHTETGTYSVIHPQNISEGQSYRAGFRYSNGILEIEVDAYTSNLTAIERVSATGLIQNTDQTLSIGLAFEGYLGSLRIGMESGERLLTALPNGESHQDITFDTSGRGSIQITSTGKISGLSQLVGVTYASINGTAEYNPQPIRFAETSNYDWLYSMLGIEDAQAALWSLRKTKRDGVTVIDKESSGWFSSLTSKIEKIAQKSVDIIKTSAKIASIIVGIDDFIVLADTIAKLAAGATSDINVIEVTFAAVGATITISTVVSAGSLAPAVVPLKLGLTAFKTAIKSVATTGGRKAALAMAKSLGKMLQDFIQSRGAPGAAFDAAKYTVFALAHLAKNVKEEIFQIFVKVIRSPLDFYNWVSTFKFFNRACGKISYGARLNSRMHLYATKNPWKSWTKSTLAAAVLGTFISNAHAANICDTAFEAFHKKIAQRVGTELADDVARLANNGIKRIEKEIVGIEKYGMEAIELSDDAIDGIIMVIKNGKDSNHVFYIAKSIAENAKKAGLSAIETEDLINQYFKYIKEVDEIPGVGKKFWGDLGKILGDPSTGWNDGFIKGQFFQLEVNSLIKKWLKDDPVEHIELAIGQSDEAVDGIRRTWDIVTKSKRKFETKNWLTYTKQAREDAEKAIEKELIVAIKNGKNNADQIIENMKNIHFIFRGSPNISGADEMIVLMKKAGEKSISTIKNTTMRKQVTMVFEQQMKEASNIVKNNIINPNTLPEIGQIVIFWGKKSAYGS